VKAFYLALVRQRWYLFCTLARSTATWGHILG
jgi:hypothetical protein